MVIAGPHAADPDHDAEHLGARGIAILHPAANVVGLQGIRAREAGVDAARVRVAQAAVEMAPELLPDDVLEVPLVVLGGDDAGVPGVVPALPDQMAQDHLVVLGVAHQQTEYRGLLQPGFRIERRGQLGRETVRDGVTVAPPIEAEAVDGGKQAPRSGPIGYALEERPIEEAAGGGELEGAVATARIGAGNCRGRKVDGSRVDVLVERPTGVTREDQVGGIARATDGLRGEGWRDPGKQGHRDQHPDS